MTGTLWARGRGVLGGGGARWRRRRGVGRGGGGDGCGHGPIWRPMLPPCVVDGRSRNPLYYYYIYSHGWGRGEGGEGW